MARFSQQTDERENTETDPNNPANSARDIHEREQQAAQDRETLRSHPDYDELEQLGDRISGAGKEVDGRESSPDTNWVNRTSPRKPGKATGKGSFTKRGGPLAIVIGGVIASAIGVSVFSPFSLVIHLMQNMTGVGDSASTAMERRFIKTFSNMNKGSDTVCASKKIKCKMGRISNSAIKKLNKKGIIAYATEDRKVQLTGGKTGYPKKNPVGYGFEDGVDKNGMKKYRYVAVEDLEKFLSSKGNFKYSAKLFGYKGAINLRVKSKMGKHAARNLYNRFGLKRDGGVADGKTKLKGSPEERQKAIRDKVKSKIPTIDSVSHKAGDIKAKLNKKLNKAKKGGLPYLMAVGACLIPKLPRIIASGVAAVQLAQIMPVAMNLVLSPGSKSQVSGVDDTDDYELTQDAAEVAGVALTETTPRKSDGKLTSAADSKILQFAAGINTARPPINAELTPGYSFLMSNTVKVSEKLDKLAKGPCDVILNPVTMYAFMSVDVAATVAASATIVGGLIKVAAQYAIQKLIAHILKAAAGDLLVNAIKKLAENDLVAQARGEELGDVIGIGAVAFFGADGMMRHLPSLRQSELAAYESVRQENEAMWRGMAVASLSPFDVSTPYTFLGSIAFKFSMAMHTEHDLFNKFMALMPNPASLATAQVGAWRGYTENYCSYASDFAVKDLGGGDDYNPSEMPTRNIAGLPCTGILPDQVKIDTAAAIDLMIEEGWLDNSGDIEVPDGATINDLVSLGIIKKDNPLYDFITECSDASTGDYLFMSESCSVIKLDGSGKEWSGNKGECYTEEDTGEEICPDETEPIEGIKNPESAIAMTPFLLDFQLVQAINGDDDEVPAADEGE